jgi:hypothetical protein
VHPDQLRDALRAIPFVPFDLRMANDRIYHVDHHELAFVNSTGHALVIEAEPGIVRILALPLVASIEFQVTPTPA